MKIYKEQNVYDAALNRIRYLFDNFKTIIVGFSGGKDSTCILELSLIVAREKNRLPLNVMWLDQEAELQATVDYCDSVFRRPEVKPYWMQVPFRLFNSSSLFDEWLYCWDEKQKDKWMRPQSDISYKENIFGTDRFHEIFTPIESWIAGHEDVAVITGLKANESNSRRMALTAHASYKDITWSSKSGKHFKFAPLYDWSNDDIWTAISKNGWEYNKHYDALYQYGVALGNMRVSSLIHETSAEWALTKVQEIEPKTYDRLCNRIGGASTYSKLMEDVRVHDLPSVFGSWEEYVEYLLVSLTPPERIKNYRRMINDNYIKKYLAKYPEHKAKVYKTICTIILANDFEGTKFHNFINTIRMEYNQKEGKYDRNYKE